MSTSIIIIIINYAKHLVLYIKKNSYMLNLLNVDMLAYMMLFTIIIGCIVLAFGLFGKKKQNHMENFCM